MLSVDWPSRVIFVPQSYLTIGATASAFLLEIDRFRRDLRALEADENEGVSFPTTHNHNTEIKISGTTIARVVELINNYTVTFEDGPYSVNIAGGNSNIGDVSNFNQVRVNSNNTAGLQSVQVPVLLEAEKNALFNILACVELMKKFDMNRTKIDENAFTLTVFDDDNITPLHVFDLTDRNSVSSIEEIFERLPK